MEQQDLRTLQGEKVKSYEELQIANWLYENGVEYEYEPVYEPKLPETGRRDYQPDFRGGPRPRQGRRSAARGPGCNRGS